MKEATICMEELKNSQNLFLDEIKSRGGSLKKQREKFKYMKACGRDIKTSIWYDGDPCKAVQKSSSRCCSLQETNKHNSSYHLHFKMQSDLAENILSWRKKKSTLNLKGAFTLKNALTFTQQSNNQTVHLKQFTYKHKISVNCYKRHLQAGWWFPQQLRKRIFLFRDQNLGDHNASYWRGAGLCTVQESLEKGSCK